MDAHKYCVQLVRHLSFVLKLLMTLSVHTTQTSGKCFSTFVYVRQVFLLLDNKLSKIIRISKHLYTNVRKRILVSQTINIDLTLFISVALNNDGLLTQMLIYYLHNLWAYIKPKTGLA